MVTQLLLDENISPFLVHQLWAQNIDALPIRDRGLLGESDSRIWQFAAKERRALVTSNKDDFVKLANASPGHDGLVVIRSGGSRMEQFAGIVAATNWALEDGNSELGFVGCMIEVDEAGTVVLVTLGQQVGISPQRVIRPN
jgi:predicted nuclease of predicted toxin-antitoxin system